MDVHVTNGSGTVKPQAPPRVSPPPRPHLGGTVHKRGWPEQARAFRAFLKLIHARCPAGVPGGSEQLALEIIEHVGELDARSLHLLRFAFAELVKLSSR